MEKRNTMYQEPPQDVGMAGHVGSSTTGVSQPRLAHLLDELSDAISTTQDNLLRVAEASHRLGPNNHLYDPEETGVQPTTQRPDRVEDRLYMLLERVHGVRQLSREVRDHLDSLV